MTKTTQNPISDLLDDGEPPYPSVFEEPAKHGPAETEKTSPTPGGRFAESDLSGVGPSVGLDTDPPSASSEAYPSHLFRLGQELATEQVEKLSEEVYERFPERTAMVPVPDQVFTALSELSGCATRLTLTMMRAVYRKTPDGWATTARHFSRDALARRLTDGLGMSAPSVRSAARELEERGWMCVSETGQSEFYRWTLPAPRSRYTPLPLGLLAGHGKIESHSALKVLLSVYRATWGWTIEGGGGPERRLCAALSTADLQERCGLSAPTIRTAAEKLDDAGAITRRRRHRGATFYWKPLHSLFSASEQKFYPHTLARDRDIQQPHRRSHTRETASDGEFVHSRGEGEGSGSDPTALSETERRHVQDLTDEPFGMPFHVAAKLISSRSARVIQQTRGAFRARREEIERPGGWMRKALEETWFGPRTDEEYEKPDRGNRGADQPLAKEFQRMAERRQGWEHKMEPGGSAGGEAGRTGGDGAPGRPAPGGDGRSHADQALRWPETAKQPKPIGLTHEQMQEAVHLIPSSVEGGWKPIDTNGETRFIATGRLVSWARRYAEEEASDELEAVARRIVEERRRYEQSAGQAEARE